MPDNPLSLHELTSQVKDVLNTGMGGLYWVVAEIAELNVNRMSGHCYLELIEKDESDKTLARVRGNIWAAQYRMIRPYFESTTGQIFESGIKVLVRITIEFHEVYGLSVNIRDIDPTYTMGDLSRRRLEILQQLEDDGVIDMNRELQFPQLPQRIAVISSANAAGYEDFFTQLENNSGNYRFSITLYEAVMQGENAASSIMRALDEIYFDLEQFDCVVIVRGGGAALDLTCFDNYELAYHITQFPLPVLSGIGHQKDDTITDLVAYHKLKTPTAVAEFLIDCMIESESKLNSLMEDMASSVSAFLEAEKNRLERALHDMPYLVKQNIQSQHSHLNHLVEKLPFSAGSFVQNQRHQLVRLSDRLRHGTTVLKSNALELMRLETRVMNQAMRMVDNEKNRVDALDVKLELLNPKHLLKKGYSITTMHGKIVKNAEVLIEGDVVSTQFYKGRAKSRVIK